MDIEKIKQRIQKFSDDRNWESFHNPKNLVMALNGEVGELNEIFQWLNFEECMNLPDVVKEHTKEEVADIAIYLIRICMKLDIDLEKAILNKMTKNEAKYPAETSQGGSKKYSKSRENR
ncbi:nucleotide pyrophosphohydrolase [Aliarcobacter butzleri]|uniref:nucleotide pyrophosphohydrolase n=1 Tax=Aliarcobacter butzleri TaxID=28197 RepID=UPI0021B42863|nr:nucleotide pyrophosphohydrolase [Aliarcobacter butzleri]MCT7549014.1 nucleotide pyrophosphohydrolase [Aliarcobacter butzleri]MCT7558325.1 nucleotide pyrophosphohydrolase [Aliarcobacter butzleri]